MLIGISGYVGPKKTGIGRTLENILSQWTIKDCKESFLLFINKDNKDFDNLIKKNGRIIGQKTNISKKSSLLNLLWHQLIYQIHLIKSRADISYIPNVTCLLWKVCPTVVVIHDLIEFNVPKKFGALRMLYRKIAVPWTAKRADAIITVSESSKNDIVKFCKVSPEKITVIHNGVDEQFRKLDKESVEKGLTKYGISFPYILYVGTVDHPGKNSITLIRAFKEIKSFHPEYKLVLVGKPGFGYNYIEQEIQKLRFEDEVIILGYVSDEDLVCLYNGAAVFVFLSLYEGFGLPLVEAMSCGVPVVAAETSCLPEIVGDAGFLVPPMDVKCVAESIKNIIQDDELRNEMVKRGLRRIEAFSWTAAARKTLKVLMELRKSCAKS